MTSERVTQCPHCKATFKVSDEQLSVANGRVRCGACMNIFDALAYVIADAAKAIQEEDTQNAVEQKAVTNEEPDVGEHKGDEGLIQDDPDEDKTEEGYSDALLSDELSDSFLELDGDADDSPSPYQESISDDEELIAADDESWADDILEDDVSQGDRTEPHISEELDIEPEAYEPEHLSAIEKQGGEVHSEAEYVQEPPKKAEKSAQDYNFTYVQEPAPRTKHWLFKGVIILFNIALLLVLIAQISWFHYEKLVRYPQAVLLFEKACSILECTLPELSDLTLIKSHNLVVRSHPTNRGALIIDAVVINDADFEQSFPDIALYFSDINGKTIAQRLIAPNEYLSQEVLSWKTMPSKEPIHISVEIVDPGRQAVNYSLKFFPAEEKGTDQSVDQLSTN